MHYGIWTTTTCWMKPRLYEGTCAMRSYQCAHVTFIFSASHAAPNHEKPYAAVNFFTSSKESPCSPETRFQQLIAAQLTRHAQVCPTASLTSVNETTQRINRCWHPPVFSSKMRPTANSLTLCWTSYDDIGIGEPPELCVDWNPPMSIVILCSFLSICPDLQRIFLAQ